MMRSRYRIRAFAVALLALSLVTAACAAGEQARGWAPPVEAGENVLIQDETGTLRALHIFSASASSVWEYPAGDDDIELEAIYAAPVVDNGIVYLAAYSGLVVALNAETGRPIDTWPGPLNLEDRILATPVLEGGRLTVVTEEGHVRHIDTATGTISPVLDELGERIWGAPALEGGTLYIGSLEREVFAVDPASGQRSAALDQPGAVAGDVVPEGDTLLVGTFDSSLRALDRASEGDARWEFRGDSWFWSRPLVQSGSLYASSVRGRVVALDPATGVQQWETVLDRGQVRAAPVLVENTLVIATRDGYLIGLDPATGAKRWEQALTEERLLADPLVQGSRILYLTDRGTLVRLNPADGQVEQLYRRE